MVLSLTRSSNVTVLWSSTVDKYLDRYGHMDIWTENPSFMVQYGSGFACLAKASGAEAFLKSSKTSALYTPFLLPIPQILFL